MTIGNMDNVIEELVQLIRVNDKKKIFSLARNVDVNKKWRGKYPLLHIAAEVGDVSIVKFLIKLGADVYCKDDIGDYPIHVATTYNHYEVLKYFIEIGVEIDLEGSNNCTPLICAASTINGGLFICEYLLKLGANIEARDIYGNTPLIEAVRSSNAGKVKLFCDYGANKSARNKYQETPKNLVKKHLKYLLNCKEDQNLRKSKIVYNFDYQIEIYKDICRYLNLKI